MAVVFPTACKLTEAERNSLSLILGEDESPCEGCAWMTMCDGPEVQRNIEEMMFADPERHCLVCGNPTGPERNSKLIAGAFRFCAEHDDEFVFTPSHTGSVDTSSPEAIEF